MKLFKNQKIGRTTEKSASKPRMGVGAYVGKRALFCNLVASSPCYNAVPGVASCVITSVLDVLLSHPSPSAPPLRGAGHFPLCLSFPICKLGTLILTLVPCGFANEILCVWIRCGLC